MEKTLKEIEELIDSIDGKHLGFFDVKGDLKKLILKAQQQVKNTVDLADVSNCSACGIEIDHKGECEVCYCRGLEAYEK